MAFVLIYSRRNVWKYVLISTLSMLTACCVYWGYDALFVQKQLTFTGQENTVFSGEITSLTIHESGWATYILKGTLNHEVPAKIKYSCDVPDYAYGDTLVLTGTPEVMKHGYVFDAADYYSSQKIFLSMPMDAWVEHTPRSQATLRSILYEWREQVTHSIQSRTETESGALMTGMLFGDKSAMTFGTKTSLYRTGIGHVLAVSGLHLDFLALFVVKFLRKCRADRRVSFAVLAALALLFVICAGETVSVKRACIMILISQSAALFYRKADTLNSMSIAMLVLTLENPLIIHSAAFWLSFSGTFGVAVFAPYLTGRMKSETFVQRQIKSMAAMCCVFLAVLPASLLYFREVSLISPLANLLIVPLCMATLVLEILSLLTGQFIGDFLLEAAEQISGLILDISAYLASQPWTYAGNDSETVLFVIAASVLLVAVCYLLRRSRKLICIAVAVSMFCTAAAAGTERYYRNQNLSIAILGEARDCVLVMRCGSDAVIADLSGNTQAPHYVGAYLQETGVRNVETVYLSNPKPKSLASYEQVLRFTSPENLIILKQSEDETPISAANCIGRYTQQQEILFHGAVISVRKEVVTVAYHDLTYVCCKEKTASIPNYEAMTIYGTSKNVLPPCGILMVLDDRSCHIADSHTYVGENNLELTVNDNGNCRVRRLYADS